MNTDWKKIISFGIIIWVLMFVIVTILKFVLNVYDNSVGKAITAIIAGAISFYLARRLKPGDIKAALTAGISWVVVGVILDAIITMRFNSAIFQSKGLWLGYLLVLIAPLLAAKKGSGSSASMPHSTPPAGQ